MTRLRGRRLGSAIGAVFGLVFVVVNAGGLTGAAALRVVAIAAFVGTLIAIRRAPDDGASPPSSAWRTYRICVVGEIVAIPVGAAVLRAAGHAELTVVWVVLVVGVHFVPFGRAFASPQFLHLGLTLITLAVAGAVVSLAGADHDGPLWTAVLAGYVLLAWALAGVLRASTTTAAPTAVTPHSGQRSPGAAA